MNGDFFVYNFFHLTNPGANQQQTSSSKPLRRMRLKTKNIKDKKTLDTCQTNEHVD
jgi:hypothetical protein